ncbi:hypothetical protein CH330_09070, partial [candidate division WOR-3 bacterium JGI_Cruoil_03_51_56]
MKKTVILGFVLTLMVFGTAIGNDSLNVRFVGNWPFGPSHAVAYDSSRQLAFCGSGGGLYILDVSDPAEPQSIAESIRTRGVVKGLFYQPSAQRLYIAAKAAGLEIWDVSTPSIPVKLGCYATPKYVYDVVVEDQYAYVAEATAGLGVIDISNPANPHEVGRCETPDDALGVAVSGQ